MRRASRALGRALCGLVLLLAPPARAVDPNALGISDPLYPAFELVQLGWPAAYLHGWRGTGVRLAFLTPFDDYASVDCNSPTLRPVLWVNPAEDPNAGGVAGVDDDGNGCVDDVHGCHFGHATPLQDGDDRVCWGDNGEPSADPPVTPFHDTAVSARAVEPVDGLSGVGVAPEARLVLVVADPNPTAFRDRVLPYLEGLGVRILITPYARDFPGETCEVEGALWIDLMGQPLLQKPQSPAWAFNYPDWWPPCEPGTLGLVAVKEDETLPLGAAGHVPTSGVDFAVPGDTQSAAHGIVAGAMAVLLQQDPTLLRTDLIHRLRATAQKIGPLPYDPSGWSSTYGTGRIDLLAALLLGDFDRDGVPGDGNASDVVGDAPCAPGASTGCDDSCPVAADPSQSDAGGLGSAVPDGTGNVCQCGDVSNDGLAGAGDVSELRAWMASLAAALVAPQKCSSEEGEACGVLSTVRLRRALASLPLAGPLPCPAARP